MKLRAALLCAALVAAPVSGQPAAEDSRAAIAAVLAHQASVRGPEGAAQTCVVGALAGLPAAAGEENAMAPDHAVRIRFQWHAPEPPAVARPAPEPEEPGRRRRQRQRPAPVPLPAALAPTLAARLDALRAEAVGAPTRLAAIDAALVPAPLRLQGAARDCSALLLTAPAFAADTAFVEIAYACGTVCGNGSLYALERREGRWEVVGIGDIWIR